MSRMSAAHAQLDHRAPRRGGNKMVGQAQRLTDLFAVGPQAQALGLNSEVVVDRQRRVVAESLVKVDVRFAR